MCRSPSTRNVDIADQFLDMRGLRATDNVEATLLCSLADLHWSNFPAVIQSPTRKWEEIRGVKKSLPGRLLRVVKKRHPPRPRQIGSLSTKTTEQPLDL